MVTCKEGGTSASDSLLVHDQRWTTGGKCRETARILTYEGNGQIRCHIRGQIRGQIRGKIKGQVSCQIGE